MLPASFKQTKSKDCPTGTRKVLTFTPMIYFLGYLLWGHWSCLSLMRSQADMVLSQQDMRSQVVHRGLGHRRRMRICQGGNRAVMGWPCLIESKNIKWAFCFACYTFLKMLLKFMWPTRWAKFSCTWPLLHQLQEFATLDKQRIGLVICIYCVLLS